MENKDIVFVSIDTKTKIFVLNDPLLKVNIEKDENNHIKLEMEYAHKTPLAFAFVFRLDDVKMPGQDAYYLNAKFASKETSYRESTIKMFIKDKQMIYNGSYYKLIN